jgi:hypothetical protein
MNLPVMNPGTCFAGVESGGASRVGQVTPTVYAGVRAADPETASREREPSKRTYVRGILREDLIVAAAALGMSDDALGCQLPGTSLAEIAFERHVDPARIADALFARALLAVTRSLQRRAISIESSVDLSDRVLQKICRLLYWRFPSSPQSPPVKTAH